MRPDWPKQALSSPSQAVPAPSPRPERKPHTPSSSGQVIYVIPQNVPAIWHLKEVIKAWQPAKFTVLRLATGCKLGSVCITIKPSRIGEQWAAQTSYYPDSIEILVNPIVTDPHEAESAMAHEFGHALGAPHITGTANSVMQPIGVYKLLPTKLDLQTVDRLGPWQIEKMADSSGKTLDVRSLPQ